MCRVVHVDSAGWSTLLEETLNAAFDGIPERLLQRQRYGGQAVLLPQVDHIHANNDNGYVPDCKCNNIDRCVEASLKPGRLYTLL